MVGKENKRDSIVSARLTDHEHELVKAAAQKRGMKLSDFLRAAILQEREDATKTRLAEIETRIAEQDQTIFQVVTALTELRVAMARGIQALLVSAETEEKEKEKARRWIRQNMLMEEEDPDA